MALADIHYTCGCGFNTIKLDKATEHADSTKHRMTVMGTVAPEKRAPAVPATTPAARKPTPAPPLEDRHIRDFNTLREKLRNKHML